MIREQIIISRYYTSLRWKKRIYCLLPVLLYFLLFCHVEILSYLLTEINKQGEHTTRYAPVYCTYSRK